MIDKVDLITTVLGKILGDASDGGVSVLHELIERCRQKARPYQCSASRSPSPASSLARGDTPIVPVLPFNAKLVNDMARGMCADGHHISDFYFSVVPRWRRAHPHASAAAVCSP